MLQHLFSDEEDLREVLAMMELVSVYMTQLAHSRCWVMVDDGALQPVAQPGLPER
jgi:hypothetical protein